jgi:hypothetical protein
LEKFSLAKATRYIRTSTKDFGKKLLGSTKVLSLGRTIRDMQSLSQTGQRHYPNNSESTTTTIQSST